MTASVGLIQRKEGTHFPYPGTVEAVADVVVVAVGVVVVVGDDDVDVTGLVDLVDDGVTLGDVLLRSIMRRQTHLRESSWTGETCSAPRRRRGPMNPLHPGNCLC